MNEFYIFSTNNSLEFSKFCNEWLKINKSHLKESTYIKYFTIIKKHIIPHLGHYKITELNSLNIADFSNNLLNEYSPETVKTVLILIRAVLKYIDCQMPNVLPLITIIYPKSAKKPMRILSHLEQEIFINYLMNDINYCKYGILLSFMTGIRIGELCALKKEHIDLNNKTLKINQSMQRLKCIDHNSVNKTKILIDTPKSPYSQRTIPLKEELLEIYEKLKYPNHSYLLTGTEKYMEPRTLQYRFQRYLKDCNLENVHFHTLRHTFATRCVEVGFEVKSLSEILGHSDTSITLNRYVHSSLELKRQNMNKLSLL